MTWKFDPILCDIVWVPEISIENGSLNFGSSINDDLSLDGGDRTKTGSIVDNGLRVIDGSF